MKTSKAWVGTNSSWKFSGSETAFGHTGIVPAMTSAGTIPNFGVSCLRRSIPRLRFPHGRNSCADASDTESRSIASDRMLLWRMWSRIVRLTGAADELILPPN